MISPKQPIDVSVQRGPDILEKQIRPEAEGSDQYGSVGWLPEQPVIVTELESNMPAGKAGLQLGDNSDFCRWHAGALRVCHDPLPAAERR